MMPQYEFDKPKAELYTSVVCHYTDGGTEDASAYSESAGSSEGIVTFELLKGSALSGTFVWANKGLDVEKPGVLNVPENLAIGGASGTVVAVAQWQNTANKYLLISNIVEASFPTADSSVTLTGADSGATFTFNPTTQRMKTKYGVERPVRIQRPMTSDLGIVRDEIVSRLIGRTDLQIVRGKFQTVKYPIVYHDLPSNSSRSTNTITWSGTIAAKERGVRKGHIVAEINSGGEYVRYAYISVVTTDESITYGASATDTSDGTALDASNTIRLVIPLRPGDVIKTVNAQSNINSDQVILSLGYDESPGMFAARYETVGSNNKFNNIFAEADEIRSTIADQANRKFPGARGDRAKGELSFFFDGFINRGSNPSDANDYRKIHWSTSAGATSGTAGTLTFSDGTKYPIACANSPTLTTAEHTIFFRNTRSRATANKSDTAFQVILSTSYAKDSEDILVGWCHASDNKAGAKAVLVLAAQFSSNNLFAAGQNGSLTEALLSKSAQEYSSGLEITPVTSGFDGPPSTRWQQVTWAACTSTAEKLTFGDGDVWDIAAKSGSNYSVTSNGTTYSNITVLAASSTYFVFVDTADTAAGGTLTLRFTTKYEHIAKSSDGATFFSSRVIMAQIAVPANGDGGAAPRVFPFNNRSLTINAASIAADAITATHITATAIDTTHLKLTGTDGIGGITVNGNINLSNVENTLSLDSTAESSTKKHVTGDQRSGGGYAYTGLNGSGRVKIPIGSGDGAKFYSYGQTSGVIVVMDNLGLIGKSGVSGSFPSFTGGTTQFEISSVDGLGKFGAGAVTAGATGLTINQVGSSNATSFLTFESASGQESKFYRLISASGYPAHTQLYSAGIAAAAHIFVTTGNGTGYWSAGTDTNDVTIGTDVYYAGFKGMYLSTSSVPAQTAVSSGVIYTKTDGHLYWKGRTSAGTAVAEVSLSSGSGDDGVFYIRSDSGAGAQYSVSTHSNTNVTTQFLGGTGINVTNSGAVFTVTSTVTDTDTWRGIDDTPVDGQTSESITSNWAYDHLNSTTAHHTNTWRPVYDSSSSSTVDSISRKGLLDHEGTTHGGGSGTVSSGTSNRFAYYSGSTTVTSANSSSSPAYLYTTGIWATSSSIYLAGIGSGAGTDLIGSGGSNLVKLSSSSRRYKEDIIDLAIDTSKVYDLVPKTFKWKDSEEPTLTEDGELDFDTMETIIGETDFGLIAEEVHEVLPELVIYNTANEPDAVRYKTIAVLLIEEMKKLKDRIEVLEGN
jgi:hypothetical protein